MERTFVGSHRRILQVCRLRPVASWARRRSASCSATAGSDGLTKVHKTDGPLPLLTTHEEAWSGGVPGHSDVPLAADHCRYFAAAARALDFWGGPFNDRPLLAHSGEPDETPVVLDLLSERRVHLVVR